MTILFHSNLRDLMIGQGLLAGGLSAASGITIYSGAQPTAAQITANWSAYNSTNGSYLVHYTGAIWTQPGQPSAGATAPTPLLQLSTVPPATTIVNSGVAAWCIIWASNVSSMGNGTLPNASFIVGSVSDSIGSGVIRFADTTMVSGVQRVILDGSFGATVV